MNSHDTLAPTLSIPLDICSHSRTNTARQVFGCYLRSNQTSEGSKRNISSDQDAPVIKEHCDKSKGADLIIVNFRTIHRCFMAICCIVLLGSCSKNVVEKPISEAMFGEYFYSPPRSGDFWSDLLNGNIIKVAPLNADYIQIIHSTLTNGGITQIQLDSVQLLGPTSFTINQFIRDPKSSSGLSSVIGTGSFGKKLLSYNIFIERNGPNGNESVIVVNARKTKD